MEKEDAAFHAFRRKQLAVQSENQELLSRLLQLKYQLEDYAFDRVR